MAIAERKLFLVEMLVTSSTKTMPSTQTVYHAADSIEQCVAEAKPLTGFQSFTITGVRGLGRVNVIPKARKR